MERTPADIDQALDRACVAIRGSSDVALACHVSPDGDALGSMLGLYHVLQHSGIDCVASFPTPFVVAPHYRKLPGLDRLTAPQAFPHEPDVMLTFDCGALGRLGDLEPPAKAARELIVIDHHISNDRYGSINVIDPDAAASGTLVHRLVEHLDLPLNRDAAVCLYTAIVCDTGRFQYDSTTPEVFQLAGELVKYGVPVPDVSRTLFEEHRFAYVQLLAEVLGNAHLVPERRFVWTSVTQDDLAKHQVMIDETEGLIDLLRRTREANVSCVLKQEADGTIRVSLRSLGEVDVCRIAEGEGGGGHRFAAGFTSGDDIDEVVARIERKLPVAP